MDILEQCDKWAQFTYGDYIEHVYGVKACTKYDKYFSALSLIHKKMTGSSVTELDRNKKSEKNSYDISFAKIFSDVINNGKTVCDYILLIIEAACKKKLSFDITIGLVCRGLRSFPSFLREMHFANLLKEILLKRDVENCIEASLELDMKKHTDLLLKCNNREYALWLYQSSQSGIENTRDKFLGNRGEIRRGFNVLCPINIKSTNGDVFYRQEWCFYSEKYIMNIIIGIMDSDRPWQYKDICNNLNTEKTKNIAFENSFISEPRIIWKD